jgi:heme oxygenase
MNTQLKEHLKTITYPLHEWLENSDIFMDIKNNQITQEKYIELLSKLYDFMRVLEPKIKTFQEDFKKNGLLDIEQRLQKEVWLKEDLDVLGVAAANEEVNFSTLNNFHSVVGALYVLEGSTMGGMQIVKMMQNQSEDKALRYYTSYQEQTMQMWTTYAQWLNRTNLNQYEASLGAMEVFIVLKKHLSN